MSIINILNVTVLNNPSKFLNNFQFQIEFECLQDLPEDLDWKLTYVGNPENQSEDQVLEELAVGPVTTGIHTFVLETPGPNPVGIKNQDLIGVTVILITCDYLNQKFVQIGYYVNNEYSEPFEPENYPNPVDIEKLYRVILADEPRVTRYAIDWTGQNPVVESLTEEERREVDRVERMEREEREAREKAGESNAMEDGDDDLAEEDDDEDDEEEDDNAEIDIDLEDDQSMEGSVSGEKDEEGRQIVFLNEDSMDVQQMQQTHLQMQLDHANTNSYLGRAVKDYL